MGFETALSEFTLVFFTTLAPSGVVALMLLSLPALLGRLSAADTVKIDHWLCIPLAVALVGLVASATHLGNPANALYVLMGIGSSPLSNEVAAAVAFLGVAALYWLSSFTEKPHLDLRRIALVILVSLGCLFVFMIAFAYDAETIVTWNTPYVPLTLWANALFGGPLLALFTMSVAYSRNRVRIGDRFGYMCLVVSGVAFAASIALYLAQGFAYQDIANSVTTAFAQVPAYYVMVVLFVVLGIGSLLLAVRVVLRKQAKTIKQVLLYFAGSTSCALLAIGIMRFAFYMSYMTVGLGR